VSPGKNRDIGNISGSSMFLTEAPAFMETLIPCKQNKKDFYERRDNMRSTAGPESNVIIFSSGKGGSGCSFIASIIATYLARKTSSNILFLDLNTGKRDSRIVFDVDDGSYRDFGDIKDLAESIDTTVLKRLVINFDNSLHLILPPLDPEKGKMLKGDNFNQFIESLRDHFDIICIDFPSHLFKYIDMNRTDIADKFVFISLPDIVSVNNTRIFMEYINSIKSHQGAYLVINKYNMRPAISPTGLTSILKYPISSFIPYDRDIEFLLNTRGPDYIFNYNLRIVRSISELSQKIYEELDI
jgi:Flp pilus assembly CpaE family ATPase